MTENKLTTVAFKCKEDEHQIIRDMAADAGCSVSKFVRDMVLRTIENETDGDHSLSVNDGVNNRPLVLSAETQDKLVRGLFMLIVDRHLELKNEGRDEYLADILKRAQELFNETQTMPDSPFGNVSEGDKPG